MWWFLIVDDDYGHSQSQGQSMQAVKKQCSAAASTISAKKPMPKTSVASKDPLSIAAKVCFNLKQ